MKKQAALLLIALLSGFSGLFAQNVYFSKTEIGNSINFVLQNNKVRQSIVIKNDYLYSDTLQAVKSWAAAFGRPAGELISDAGFSLDVVWAGLRAPGKNNNAANPVKFKESDFIYDHYTLTDSAKGAKQINLFFKGKNNPFHLQVIYRLEPEKFYARRKIAVSDPTLHGHFLDRINSRKGNFVFEETTNHARQTADISIEGMHFAYSEQVLLKNGSGHPLQILKAGGFGQPVAFANQNSGGFIGLEYPTGTTNIKVLKNNLFTINSFQYFGQRIESQPIESNWEVTAITP